MKTLSITRSKELVKEWDKNKRLIQNPAIKQLLVYNKQLNKYYIWTWNTSTGFCMNDRTKFDGKFFHIGKKGVVNGKLSNEIEWVPTLDLFMVLTDAELDKLFVQPLKTIKGRAELLYNLVNSKDWEDWAR